MWGAWMKSDQERPSDFVERQSERTPVAATTSMRSERWYSIEVTVRDVSPVGFMAECPHPIAIGSSVWLDVPGIGPIQAQVRWQLAGRMGGLFLDPISLTKCKWTAVKAEPPQVPA